MMNFLEIYTILMIMKRIQQKQINDNDDSSNSQINLQTHDENILQQNNNPIIEDIPH